MNLNMALKKSLKQAVGVSIAVLFCSTSAQAAVTWTTWNLKEGPTGSGGSISGDERTVGLLGNQSTFTAWGNTSGTDGSANAEYRQKDLWEWSSGIGAGPGSAPEHAIGDYNSHEFILFEFDMTTALTDLEIGYKSGDSDMTVMAFTGNARVPTFTRADMNVRNSDPTDNDNSGTLGLTHAGWELISNPMNVQTNVLTSIGNTSGVSSKYWLVGTYNNHLNGVNSNSYNDFFKLKYVKGFKVDAPPPGVPVPGSAALIGLGLLALGRKRFYKLIK